MEPPHLLDLFCGRGGWTNPALARGWTATGVDVVDHGYRGRLVLRKLPADISDLITPATRLIVASPPCDQFARHHLPWLQVQGPLDIRCLTWAISLGSTLGVPALVECNRFAGWHVAGGIYHRPYTLWGNVPALLPHLPESKDKRRGGSHLETAERTARAAMIDPVLADWIISLATPNPLFHG